MGTADTLFFTKKTAEILGKGSLPNFSLPTPMDTVVAPLRITAKSNSAADIFSASSYINPDVDYGSSATDVFSDIKLFSGDSWQVSVFLMLILGYYIFVLYRFLPLYSNIFRVAFSVKKTLTLYEIRNNNQSSLMFHSFVLNIVLMAMVAYVIVPSYITMQPFILLGILIGAVMLMQLYKFLILTLCRIMSDSAGDFENLSTIRINTMSITAMIGIPVAVVIMIEPGDNYLILLLILILWIYALIRILSLFIVNGFGVLRWILYLCTVELLPLSYLIAIAERC